MPKITLAEARAAGEELGLPPIITLEEAALVARQSPFTIKRKVSEGYFPKSARPGKPLRFWRDKYIVELMQERRREGPAVVSSNGHRQPLGMVGSPLSN